MNGWDARSGIRYAAWTAIKLAILYAAVIALCTLALSSFCAAAGMEADPFSLITESPAYAIPFAPVPFIALMAGGFAPGDRRRLTARLLMSVYLVTVIILVTGDLSYSVHGIAIPHESGAVVDGASLEMTATGFAAILILVPVLSAIDALLERRTEPDEDTDDGSME